MGFCDVERSEQQQFIIRQLPLAQRSLNVLQFRGKFRRKHQRFFLRCVLIMNHRDPSGFFPNHVAATAQLYDASELDTDKSGLTSLAASGSFPSSASLNCASDTESFASAEMHSATR